MARDSKRLESLWEELVTVAKFIQYVPNHSGVEVLAHESEEFGVVLPLHRSFLVLG